MKKILCILLSSVIILGCFSVAFAGSDLVEDVTKYPIIFVPGYATSTFYSIDEETGEQKPVWGNDPIAQIMDGSSAERLLEILRGVGNFITTSEADELAKVLNDGFRRIFADFACKPDGQGVCEVYNYVNTPAETNYKYLAENYPDGEYQTELEIAQALGEEIGLENIFVFTCDFRMGAVQLATELKGYIDEVIEYCNENRSEKDKIDKVNLYGLSHGGQISGTYLTLYGDEGKVNNAVLLQPALAGAAIAYDAYGSGEAFADRVLIDFLEHGLVVEEELDVLLEAVNLGFIDELFQALLAECLGHIRYWSSMWDFIPLDCYEEYKAKHLDPVECEVLIKQSDFVHYEIMSPGGEYYYADGFKKAEEAGARIYIMAGYDIQAVTGMTASTDAIVPVASATGATVADFGKRFADGYTQKVDTGFYQVSPSMTIDASTAYLPERTWFIEDSYHGMALYDDYTRTLLYKLLLNDGEAYDVHNMEGYPQFHATTNPSHIIFAEFDKSQEGYLSSQDKELVISNISYDSIVTVSAINVSGADMEFSFFPFILKPGESRAVEFEGEVPKADIKNIEVNVTFFNNKITPVSEREFDFTIRNNGEKVEFDSENPMCDADYPEKIAQIIDTGKLEKFGLKKVVTYIYNAASQLIRLFTRLMSF